MDPVLRLAEQYRGELEQGVQEIRKRTISVQKDLTERAELYQKQAEVLKPELLKKKDEVLSWLQNQSPIAELDKANLMSTFAWTGVLLLTVTVGGILGWTVFGLILGLFISSFFAFIAAYAVLPAAAFFYLLKPVEQNAEVDRTRRHALLVFALLEGILTGYMLSEKYLTGPPPLAALTPLIIAIGAQLGASLIGSDRVKLLGIAVGGGLIVHVVLGVVFGLSFPYLLLTLLYTATGFISLQIYITNAAKVPSHIYQLSFVSAVLFSQLLVYGVFGVAAEDLVEPESSS